MSDEIPVTGVAPLLVPHALATCHDDGWVTFDTRHISGNVYQCSRADAIELRDWLLRAFPIGDER